MRGLSAKQVASIIALYRTGEWNQIELAQQFDISKSTVSAILTGKRYRSVTGGANISTSGQTTAYRIAHIQARLDQGRTNLSEIARELGITRQAVGSLIRSHGITKTTKES